jgi:hypothetical protein
LLIVGTQPPDDTLPLLLNALLVQRHETFEDYGRSSGQLQP